MFLRVSLLLFAAVPAIHSDETCAGGVCEDIAQEIQADANIEIHPCDNFYGYVCGNRQPRDDRSQIMIDILNTVEPVTPVQRQAYLFYRSCVLQSTPVERRANFAALNNMVRDLGGWIVDADLSDFNGVVQRAHQKYRLDVFFSWKVTQDLENPAKAVPSISMDTFSADLLLKPGTAPDQFCEFILQLMHMWNRGIYGVKPPDIQLELTDVIELHKQLQIRTRRPESPRKMRMAEIAQIAPFLDWVSFFAMAYDTVGVSLFPSAPMVQIEYPETLSQVSAVVSQYLSEPPRKALLHHYIILRALFEMSQNLAPADENLEERCVEEGFTEMTPIFNSIFVRNVIPPGSLVREDVTTMFFALRRALLNTLPQLTRLDESRLNYLTQQLERVHFFAGYMNTSFDDEFFAEKYSTLDLEGKCFIENKLILREFSKTENVAHAPNYVVEDFLDGFRVNEVNAFFSKKRNSIYLPVGLMMKPFYELQYPDFLKYGAIGSILAHELTHALMTNLVNVAPGGWEVTPAEAVFRERAMCFVKQYSSYGTENMRVDGLATLEENLGDNIGLAIAFHVYKSRATGRVHLPQLGLNSDQLFFVSYARSFCVRPGERDSQALLSNAHTPDSYRVNGALSNIRDFSLAFKCNRNSLMTSDYKCNAWESEVGRACVCDDLSVWLVMNSRKTVIKPQILRHLFLFKPLVVV
ncbi:endothelin-converting enzyme homolog [Galendromus occidentalis]|uniref:Endothelin-converting enzyme homolog n=1 Tax=Galendromus occidentalis TaxID=34638 RepID=A0AAJ6QU44_9ACAR|nr:endothelin-converting enzyme homolog [Galendromus occidentalis]